MKDNFIEQGRIKTEQDEIKKEQERLKKEQMKSDTDLSKAKSKTAIYEINKIRHPDNSQ